MPFPPTHHILTHTWGPSARHAPQHEFETAMADTKKVVKKATTVKGEKEEKTPTKPPGTPPTAKRPASAKKPPSTTKEPAAAKPSTPAKKVKDEKGEKTTTKKVKEGEKKDATKKVKKEGSAKELVSKSPKVTKKVGTAKEKDKDKDKGEKKKKVVKKSESQESLHAESPEESEEEVVVVVEEKEEKEEKEKAVEEKEEEREEKEEAEGNHHEPPSPPATTTQDPPTRLHTLLDDCQGNTDLLLDLYKIFTEYLKQKGLVLPPSLSPPSSDHPSPTEVPTDPILQLYSSYPRRTSTGAALTLSLDGLNLSTNLDTPSSIQNLSAQDKAALRAKAIERIKNIKERNSLTGSTGGMNVGFNGVSVGASSGATGEANGTSPTTSPTSSLGGPTSMLTTL